MDQQWAEILTKLEGVKTLQERAGTQGEAEAASAALSRLLVKYNLTMVELDARLGTKQSDDGYVRVGVDVGAAQQWRRQLFHVIAVATYCTTIYIPRTSRVTIVGEQHNITAVWELYEWLVPTCERLAQLEWTRQYLAGKIHRSTARSWQASFKAGFVSGIGAAMRAAKVAAEDAIPGGSALVVIKNEALNAAKERLVGETKAGSRLAVGNFDGYREGVEAGRAQDVGRTKKLTASAD